MCSRTLESLKKKAEREKDFKISHHGGGYNPFEKTL
jgi:hypothetical protein